MTRIKFGRGKGESMRGSVYQWALIAGLMGPLMGGVALQGEVPEVGDVAPDFTLEQLGGGQATLSEFRGRVVFINFFGFN